MTNISNLKLRSTNSNTIAQKVWEYINTFPGESRADIVKALIQEFQSVNSYISSYLSSGLIKYIDGGLYTTTKTYVVESDLKRITKSPVKNNYLKEVPKDNILEGIVDIKFEKKKVEPIKNYVEEKMFIRGYIGREGNIIMTVSKEKLSVYPDSTQWVVLGVFHKYVNAKNLPQYILPEKTKLALEEKTGLRNLAFHCGKIKSTDEVKSIVNPFSKK